jgi:hypothetical protein
MIFEHGVRFEEPYPMLFTRRAFPWEIYREITKQLPDSSFYVPNSPGRHCHGGRASLSLVHRRIDPLPLGQRHFWTCMREVLHDPELKEHVCDKLGVDWRGLHTFACLMRDTKGYKIDVHPDWDMKVVTVQCYLPQDPYLGDIGTEIYDKDKRLVRRLPFEPNVAYAFARSDTSFHAVSEIPDVTRDSLMLTYTREPWDEY